MAKERTPYEEYNLTLEDAWKYLGLDQAMTLRRFKFSMVTKGVIKSSRIARGVYWFSKKDLDDYKFSMRNSIYR